MPTTYSKLAHDFQLSVIEGAEFHVRRNTSHPQLANKVLVVQRVLTHPTNPDDWLYLVSDDDGKEHKIWGWWLRKCCERVG